MGPQTVARALIFMGIMALVLIGFGFAGYALYLAWLPVLAPAGAAAATAIALLSIPAIWIVSVALRAGGNAPARVDDNTLAALASIAKDKPLFAMFLAGLVGAAGAVNGKR